jgi:hypothetical protein
VQSQRIVPPHVTNSQCFHPIDSALLAELLSASCFRSRISTSLTRHFPGVRPLHEVEK